MRFKLFLSTPSARRATLRRELFQQRIRDFYPRPPRGGRHWPAGRDWASWYFYPRPPRGGRRPRSMLGQRGLIFLSTPSARRATGDTSELRSSLAFLSTPSARRATSLPRRQSCQTSISIHALREEGDYIREATFSAWTIFLSTPSVRRATPSCLPCPKTV